MYLAVKWHTNQQNELLLDDTLSVHTCVCLYESSLVFQELPLVQSKNREHQKHVGLWEEKKNKKKLNLWCKRTCARTHTKQTVVKAAAHSFANVFSFHKGKISRDTLLFLIPNVWNIVIQKNSLFPFALEEILTLSPFKSLCTPASPSAPPSTFPQLFHSHSLTDG